MLAGPAGLDPGSADDGVRLAAGGDPDQLRVQLGLGGEQLDAPGGLGLHGGQVAQGRVLRVPEPLDRGVGDLLDAESEVAEILSGAVHRRGGGLRRWSERGLRGLDRYPQRGRGRGARVHGRRVGLVEGLARERVELGDRQDRGYGGQLDRGQLAGRLRLGLGGDGLGHGLDGDGLDGNGFRLDGGRLRLLGRRLLRAGRSLGSRSWSGRDLRDRLRLGDGLGCSTTSTTASSSSSSRTSTGAGTVSGPQRAQRSEGSLCDRFGVTGAELRDQTVGEVDLADPAAHRQTQQIIDRGRRLDRVGLLLDHCGTPSVRSLWLAGSFGSVAVVAPVGCRASTLGSNPAGTPRST